MSSKKQNILLVLFLLLGHFSFSQCLTNSLVINTGYNPVTGLAIAPGIDGGTPVPDPMWRVSAISPGALLAIGAAGNIPVAIGANADVIARVSSWVANPIGFPGNYISCQNSTTYNTDGTGPSGTVYNMLLTRPFRMCTDDSITFDLYISNDNFITVIDVDGTPLLFSQPAAASTAHFTAYTHFTQTIYLTAGSHTMNVLCGNYNTFGISANPTGVNIYGTFSSAGGLGSLVSEANPTCATYVCNHTCNTLTMPDTMRLCVGESDTIGAGITGTDSVISIRWSPVTGISDTTALQPVVTGSTSGYKHLWVQSLNPYNLVVNGDFEARNMGFTSSYGYTPPPSTVLLEGRYSVYDDPFGVHTGFTSFGDHTSGSGYMMIINGASTPVDVWCQTIAVNPNTDYNFSAWFANCSRITAGVDEPTLQFRINGVLQGVPVTLGTAVGVWSSFFARWNSGASTTATICIYDSQTSASGNDFVIDDISFQEICNARDSTYIAITIPDTTFSSQDTTLCIASAPLRLTATPGFDTYTWSTGATTTFLNVVATGTYWVYRTRDCEVYVDTFHVNFIPLPLIDLGNDTAFCIGFSLLLQSPQPAGTTHLWNTGATTDSIRVTSSGNYWLQLDNGCIVSDTIRVLISPYPLVNLGPDTLNCDGSPLRLASSVTYTAPSYLWSDGSTTSAITAFNSGTYWLQVTDGGCSDADTISVRIIFDTFTLFNRDTAICRGMSVQALLTANPVATFQWLPTAGIAASRTASPLISPDTSAMYVANIYIEGCPVQQDSFFIDVQPVPEVFIGNYMMACQFETLNMRPMVLPGWYDHYQYRWSPSLYLNDTSDYSVSFLADTADTVTISLTVTTPAGCRGTNITKITVHPGNFGSIMGDTVICPHETTRLWAAGAERYNWYPKIYLNDYNTDSPLIYPITTQQYTVVATSIHGCRDTLNVNITVHPDAVLYVGDSILLYPGEQYHIQPQTNCVQFSWTPATGLSNPWIADPIAMPGSDTRYIVIGTSEDGCTTVDTLNVRVSSESLLDMPNAFNPGGINKSFKVLKRGNATLLYFRIFNRWGNLLFETTNINEGWDGTYNGTPQPMGVYIYEMSAQSSDGASFRKKGNVTLIR